MRPTGYPDCFEAINGPEDGTEFPIARAPLYIGRDPVCAVNVRLDESVRARHARVTVVSGGYRIRSVNGAATYVNGARVGSVRSRIVREGGQVQVGNTLLRLECAPDGLAGRSVGIPTENDIVWAFRNVASKAWGLTRGVTTSFFGAIGGMLAHWKLAVLAVLVVLFFVNPRFQYMARRLLGWCWNHVSALLG